MREYELRLSVLDCGACHREIVTVQLHGDELDVAGEDDLARAFVKHRFPTALILAADAEGDVHCPCGNAVGGDAARDADRETLRTFRPQHTPELM